MKIVMVTEFLTTKEKPYFGGVDARTINLAKQLAKNNDVHIITSFNFKGERTENYDGIQIHRIGKKRPFTQRGYFLERLKFNSIAISEVSKLHPDIVDGSGFISYSCCYKSAKKIGVPSTATIHEVWQGQWIQNVGLINGFTGHFLEKHYLRYNFNGYISVSNFTKEKLIEQIRIPKEKIMVIYNGIDLNLFKKTHVNEKYKEPTVLTICRLVSYKRVEDLIKAINILKADIPDIRLKIIGDGPQKEYLINLAKNLQVIDRVEFLGKIKETQDMIKIMKKSHVFALPSIAEGFGMVVIEALAAGVPYVSSDIPPIREITKGGIGGILCETKNYKDLTSKIKVLLVDESKRRNVMKNVSSHIEKFEWSNLAIELEKYYKKLCNGV